MYRGNVFKCGAFLFLKYFLNGCWGRSLGTRVRDWGLRQETGAVACGRHPVRLGMRFVPKGWA